VGFQRKDVSIEESVRARRTKVKETFNAKTLQDCLVVSPARITSLPEELREDSGSGDKNSRGLRAMLI